MIINSTCEQVRSLAVVKRIIGILLAGFVLISCQKTVDINEVEPSALDKNSLSGEWYHRALVADKQYGTASSFIGLACDLDRIKFEITEDKLLAFRSYEKVVGTQSTGDNKRSLVAAFPIEKHFDIMRVYNAVTGVESNIITENSSERRWQDRKYIRVNWNENLVPDIQCNDWMRATITQSIARDETSEASNPWRPRVTDGYIETTIEGIARPSTEACEQLGEVNCQGSSVKMKFSFLKIKASNDYLKRNYLDHEAIKVGENRQGNPCVEGETECNNIQELWVSSGPRGPEKCDLSRDNIDRCQRQILPVFSRFGYFRTDRYSFDREKGFTFSGKEQLINRWNLWRSSKDEHGAVIPLDRRVPQAIVYYTNVDFPDDLLVAAQEVAADWSTAFSDTVAQLKNMCTVDNANAYVAQHGLRQKMADFGLPKVTSMNLLSACAKIVEFANAQGLPVFLRGDYRQIEELYGKLFIVKKNDCNLESVNEFITKHKLNSGLAEHGIESVARGNLAEVCSTLEAYSKALGIEQFQWQRVGDLRYSFINYTKRAEQKGPLGYGPSAADPLTGEIVNAAANVYGASLDIYAAQGADMVQLLNGGMSIEDITNDKQPVISNQITSRNAQISSNDLAHFNATVATRVAVSAYEGEERFSPLASTEGKMQRLKSSGFEDKYLPDELIRIFNSDVDGKKGKSSPNINNAYVHSWARPELFDARNQHGKSGRIAITFDRRASFLGEKTACFLAETMEPAVADLALSLKGMSWEEAYTVIRRNVFKAVVSHELGHTFGLRHNFEASTDALNFPPDYWKVHTEDHRMSKWTKSKSEMQYSSIMDYHQLFNSDFAGIGLYDKAAIKFGYGELVEVFDDPDQRFIPKQVLANLNNFHYTDLPYLFSGSRSLQSVLSRPRDGQLEGPRFATPDLIPMPDNMFKRKNVSFEQYYKAKAFRAFGAEGGGSDSVYEVPYRFCSDAYAGGSSMTCDRWDMGASAEEVVDNAARLYDAYYLFRSYRRNAIHFDTRGYLAQVYGRIYRPMLNAFNNMYVERRNNSEMSPRIADLSIAAYKGLNFLGSILQTVEPGRYCLVYGKYAMEEKGRLCEHPLEISEQQGRGYSSDWSDEYNFKLNRVGHMYDKILALQALSDSVDFSENDAARSTKRGLSSGGYYRLFAPEMVKLFSSIMLDRSEGFAPKVLFENGVPRIEYQPVVRSGLNLQSAGVTIEPSRSWILSYYGMVLPMVNFSSTKDRNLDYASLSRISLAGSSTDPTPGETIKQVLFTDPSTGYSYRAAAPLGAEMAPGYQLLVDARSFVSDGSDGTAPGSWGKSKSKMDISRKLLDEALSSNDKEKVATIERELADAERDFRQQNRLLFKKVQMIDMMRSLSDLLSFGG